MKKIMLLGLMAALLAGCEDFPIESGGEDDFAGAAHHQARATRAHGGMDDHLLRIAEER